MAEQYPIVRVYNFSKFTHSAVGGHLSCFHFLAISDICWLLLLSVFLIIAILVDGKVNCSFDLHAFDD